MRQLVDAEFLRLSLTSGAAVVAPISVIAFLWVTSAGISTAMGVFEAMFHSPERPWYIRRFIAMGAVVGSLSGLFVILTVGLFVARVWGRLRGAAVLAGVVPPLVVVGMLCGFFRIAIRGPRPCSAAACSLGRARHPAFVDPRERRLQLLRSRGDFSRYATLYEWARRRRDLPLLALAPRPLTPRRRRGQRPARRCPRRWRARIHGRPPNRDSSRPDDRAARARLVGLRSDRRRAPNLPNADPKASATSSPFFSDISHRAKARYRRILKHATSSRTRKFVTMFG